MCKRQHLLKTESHKAERYWVSLISTVMGACPAVAPSLIPRSLPDEAMLLGNDAEARRDGVEAGMGMLSAIVATHPPAKTAGRVGQPDL
jgi:hypothetical protein